MLEKLIQKTIVKYLPSHQSEFASMYDYALFPTGKLFRAKLVKSIYEDLTHKEMNESSDHALLCTSIEVHHAYTLVHDDLPAMDNDDYRRGKLSTHKKYGEAQAILVGDGLLTASFSLFSHMKSQNTLKALSFFTRACGAKGLILGQMKDLKTEEIENRLNFSDLLDIHTLKTSRLIQAALCSSYLLLCEEVRSDKSNSLSAKRYELSTFKNLFRLGHYLGILFQLIDDKNELKEKLSKHELKINPWVIYKDECQYYFEFTKSKLETFFKKYSYPKLHSLIFDYLKNL